MRLNDGLVTVNHIVNHLVLGFSRQVACLLDAQQAGCQVLPCFIYLRTGIGLGVRVNRGLLRLRHLALGVAGQCVFLGLPVELACVRIDSVPVLDCIACRLIAVLNGIAVQCQATLVVHRGQRANLILLLGPLVCSQVEVGHERISGECVAVAAERVAGIGVEACGLTVQPCISSGNREGCVIHRRVSSSLRHGAVEQATPVCGL